MVRYLSMLTYTDQGIRNVARSAERAQTFCANVEAAGGRMVGQYWSLGEVDGCVIFEAPDDSIAAGLLLKLGKLGNVRTKSVRVFNEQEFSAIAVQS